MKPLMLHGHERSVTQLKYSREGDLLFSCAKDSQPNVWFSLNGERLGTFKGHGGAVWCIDVDWQTAHVMTGSADNSCRIWDCETGVQTHIFDTKSAVRTNGFSYSGNLAMYSTDKAMGHPCELVVYDLRDSNQVKNCEPMLTFPLPKSKVTAAVWGALEETIITGHENGDINLWDVQSTDIIQQSMDHTKMICDLQLTKDQNVLISASKDFTARLFDATNLEHKKTYKTERPVNSAAISPLKPHIVMGGGQEAMDVTTSSSRIGKFDARFYHLVFEDEFARVKGHFGPINSIVFHPDGRSYSSGGEDGYIRVHNFDPQYFDFEFEF